MLMNLSERYRRKLVDKDHILVGLLLVTRLCLCRTWSNPHLTLQVVKRMHVCYQWVNIIMEPLMSGSRERFILGRPHFGDCIWFLVSESHSSNIPEWKGISCSHHCLRVHQPCKRCMLMLREVVQLKCSARNGEVDSKEAREKERKVTRNGMEKKSLFVY